MGSLLSHSVTCCLRRYLLCCLNSSVWVVCSAFMPLNWFGWEWENGVNWSPGLWSFPLLYCVKKSVARNSVNVVRMEKKGCLGQINTPGRVLHSSLWKLLHYCCPLLSAGSKAGRACCLLLKSSGKLPTVLQTTYSYLKYPQLESRGEAMWRECWALWWSSIFMTYCCVHGEDNKVGQAAWVDIGGCPWR